LPTIATALGNVVAAGFLLWAFQRAFLAPRPKDLPAARIARTRRMEYFVGGATLLVLLAAGFYPEPWLQLTDTATQALAAYFSTWLNSPSYPLLSIAAGPAAGLARC
jgi:NADH-quinone oxidoreductase subunit M